MLFYDKYIYGARGFFGYWTVHMSIDDLKGNLGFIDVPSNMFVVVSTGIPELHVDPIPRDATPTSAKLLYDSKFEHVVHVNRNTLTIISPDGQESVFQLPAGNAEKIYDSAYLDCDLGKANLLDKIRLLYTGADKEKLQKVLDAMLQPPNRVRTD